MKNYKKKPVTVQAIQLTLDNRDSLVQLFDEGFDGEINVTSKPIHTGRIWATINTLEGKMLATEYDWIIKGVKGEFYSCKPDIFKLTYEVDDD